MNRQRRRLHALDLASASLEAGASLEERARIVHEFMHEEILTNSEDVLKGLGLPYRIVALCGGDLGRSAAYTYDIETWMPGRGDFGETHSASRYYEYQARRLNLRYRDGELLPGPVGMALLYDR